MNQGKYVFSQLMSLISHKQFQTLVTRHKGDYKVKDFSCWKQYLYVAFGQLTHWESLIVLCHGQRICRLQAALPHSSLQSILYNTGKDNMNCWRIRSYPSDKSKAVICDQTVLLNNYYAAIDYSEKIRRIKFYDEESGKTFIFLTNNFHLKATEVAQLYKHRWKIELFFKWIKSI